MHDDGANINVFCNKDLIIDLCPTTTIHPYGLGGVSEISQKGWHPIFGEVYYSETVPYNILSRSMLKQNGWRYKTDSENERLFYHHERYKPITFYEDRDGMFKVEAMEVWNAYTSEEMDIKSKINKVVNSVMTYVTSEQRARADKAITLHYLLNHPSDKALTAFLQSSSVINVPITASDLKRARELYGICKECQCGKPIPHKGTHTSYSREDASTIGSILHADIIEIQQDYCLFAVDDACNFMMLNYMANKRMEEVCRSLSYIIRHVASNGHTVKTILTDSEVSIMSCRNYLEDTHNVKLRHYIPYEHEKVVERQVRILRERIKCKLAELPYKLPRELYLALAVHAIDLINMLPNSKTGLISPRELMCSEKTNYLTDITASFGAAVLVNGGKPITSTNKIGIMLGRSETAKGGIYVFIPGEKRIKVRRNLKSQPMTMEIINTMNSIAEGTDPELALIMNRLTSKETINPDDDYDLNRMDLNIQDDINSYKENIINLATSSEKGSMPGVQEGVGVDNNSTILIPVEPEISNEPTPDDNKVAAPPSIANGASIETPLSIANGVALPPIANGASIETSLSIANGVGVTPRRSSRINKGENSKLDIYKVNTIKTLTSKLCMSLAAKDYQNGKSDIPSDADFDDSVSFTQLMKQVSKEHAKAIEETVCCEFKQLVTFNTWKYLKQESDRTPSTHTGIEPCKMLMKIKRDAMGKFIKWKARLVNGGHKTKDIEYGPFEKSSPTTTLETVLMQLAVAQHNGYHVESFDVPGAYLHATLDKDKRHVMRIPSTLAPYLITVDERAIQYMQKDGSILVELKKSLYGLPEAGKLFNQLLSGILVKSGYIQCGYDKCLFVKSLGKRRCIITVHVDDALMTSNCKIMMADLYQSLIDNKLPEVTKHILKDKGNITHLGMLIENENGVFKLSQPGYIDDLLKGHDPGVTSKSPCDPFEVNHDPESRGRKIPLKDFLSKLHKLYYLGIRTRPDIMTACAYISTNSHDPREDDMKRVNKIYAYIKGTRDMKWIMDTKYNKLELELLTDSAFAVHYDRRSHTGKMIVIGDNGFPVAIKSHKQKINTTSSTESELVGLHDSLDLLMWCREIMKFMGYEQNCTKIFVDNTSTITQAYMGKPSNNNKRWIDIKYFWIKELIDNGHVELHHKPREEMTADLFASIRVGKGFYKYREAIHVL